MDDKLSNQCLCWLVIIHNAISKDKAMYFLKLLRQRVDSMLFKEGYLLGAKGKISRYNGPKCT